MWQKGSLCIICCLCLLLLTPKTGCKAEHLLFTCIREQRGGKPLLFQWQIPTVNSLPREINNKIQPQKQSLFLGHWAGCFIFCPTALRITACSQVLASTVLSRVKMKFSSQVGRAASRTMVHSPLHPTVLKSWELVCYIDLKIIYQKNPEMYHSLDGRQGTRPENWAHKSQQLDTKELQLKLSHPLAIRHTSRVISHAGQEARNKPSCWLFFLLPTCFPLMLGSCYSTLVS